MSRPGLFNPEYHRRYTLPVGLGGYKASRVAQLEKQTDASMKASAEKRPNKTPNQLGQPTPKPKISVRDSGQTKHPRPQKNAQLSSRLTKTWTRLALAFSSLSTAEGFSCLPDACTPPLTLVNWTSYDLDIPSGGPTADTRWTSFLTDVGLQNYGIGEADFDCIRGPMLIQSVLSKAQLIQISKSQLEVAILNQDSQATLISCSGSARIPCVAEQCASQSYLFFDFLDDTQSAALATQFNIPLDSLDCIDIPTLSGHLNEKVQSGQLTQPVVQLAIEGLGGQAVPCNEGDTDRHIRQTQFTFQSRCVTTGALVPTPCSPLEMLNYQATTENRQTWILEYQRQGLAETLNFISTRGPGLQTEFGMWNAIYDDMPAPDQTHVSPPPLLPAEVLDSTENLYTAQSWMQSFLINQTRLQITKSQNLFTQLNITDAIFKRVERNLTSFSQDLSTSNEGLTQSTQEQARIQSELSRIEAQVEVVEQRSLETEALVLEIGETTTADSATLSIANSTAYAALEISVSAEALTTASAANLTRLSQTRRHQIWVQFDTVSQKRDGLQQSIRTEIDALVPNKPTTTESEILDIDEASLNRLSDWAVSFDGELTGRIVNESQVTREASTSTTDRTLSDIVNQYDQWVSVYNDLEDASGYTPPPFQMSETPSPQDLDDATLWTAHFSAQLIDQTTDTATGSKSDSSQALIASAETQSALDSVSPRVNQHDSLSSATQDYVANTIGSRFMAYANAISNCMVLHQREQSPGSNCHIGNTVIFDDVVSQLLPRQYDYPIPADGPRLFFIPQGDPESGSLVIQELTQPHYQNILDQFTAGGAPPSSTMALEAARHELRAPSDSFLISSRLMESSEYLRPFEFEAFRLEQFNANYESEEISYFSKAFKDIDSYINLGRYFVYASFSSMLLYATISGIRCCLSRKGRQGFRSLDQAQSRIEDAGGPPVIGHQDSRISPYKPEGYKTLGGRRVSIDYAHRRQNSGGLLDGSQQKGFGSGEFYSVNSNEKDRKDRHVEEDEGGSGPVSFSRPAFEALDTYMDEAEVLGEDPLLQDTDD